MKLSMCTILKNEGQTIYRCLDSMKTFVDEWIIGIDDTTNDNTKEEVKKFFTDNKLPCNIYYDQTSEDVNNIVYEYKWQNDFSKARNEGMDKATGDYILIIDGHEFFPEEWYNISEGRSFPCIKCLEEIIKRFDNDYPAGMDEIFVQLYQQPFTGNVPSNYFLQPRIYRNDPKLRFGRAAHNTIMNSDSEKRLNLIEVILIHDAPESNRKERHTQRIEMNIKALHEDLKRNPKDTRAMFYLGNTFMEDKKFDDAIKAYDDYMANRKDDNSEKYQVLIHRALCYKEKQMHDDAKISCHYAIKTDPSRRDAYCILGDICLIQKKWDEALIYYNQALMLRPLATPMFSHGAVYTWLPHINMATAYEELKDNQKAILHLTGALNYVKNQAWKDKIKKLKGYKKNIYIVDSIGSFTSEFSKHLKNKGYEVITTKEYSRQIAEWADYIWQEWADNNAIMSSKHGKKTTIRFIGYEAYSNGEILNNINFGDTKVIFIAKHIQNMMKQYVNGNGTVIQVGVNCHNFSIRDTKRNTKNIGYAGYINEKKNPELLYRIIKANPEYIFNLRCDWQSAFWKRRFEQADFKNIVYHGRYDNLADFWNQMSITLSTSIIESFSYNIAEGMACGCKPYIYNWEGAEDIWGKQWIFDDMPEFTENITDAERYLYRQYVIEKYENKNQMNQMEKVLIS